MARLRVQAPGAEPRVVELTGDLVVGRMAPADLVVDDAKMSRRHCRIARSGAGWIVEDLGSSNGTRVNGAVVKARPIAPGDRIEAGLTTLVLELDVPTATYAAPLRRASARDRLR